MIRFKPFQSVSVNSIINGDAARVLRKYLAIAIGQILHHTPRREPATLHVSRRIRTALPDRVDGYVGDGPSTLRELFTEPEEVDLSDGDQWGENLELRMHLVNINQQNKFSKLLTLKRVI